MRHWSCKPSMRHSEEIEAMGLNDNDLYRFELLEKLFKNFPVQVYGYPTSKSQFGISYDIWINGCIIPEGGTIPIWHSSTSELIDALIEHLKNAIARNENNSVIVWRTFPYFDWVNEPIKLVLRARYHLMHKGDIAAILDAQEH